MTPPQEVWAAEGYHQTSGGAVVPCQPALFRMTARKDADHGGHEDRSSLEAIPAQERWSTGMNCSSAMLGEGASV